MYKGNEINFFADRIKQARLASEMSQSELARVLGVKPQAVQHWENGTSNPKIERITNVALALGVTPSWLLLGDEQHQDSVHEPSLHYYNKLSFDEKFLIKIFRKMKSDQKNFFSEMGKVILKNNDE